jgi:hypothetical protein
MQTESRAAIKRKRLEADFLFMTHAPFRVGNNISWVRMKTDRIRGTAGGMKPSYIKGRENFTAVQQKLSGVRAASLRK